MARDHDRLSGDNAGIGPEPGRADRLHRLSDSHHFRIASGEPDIRGWEVRTLSGSHLGEVEDLLIDPHRGEVVMLDVDLNDSPDRINLPIRGVQLDRGRRCVIVDSGDIRDAQTAIDHDTLHDDHPRHDVVDNGVDDLRDRGDLTDDTSRDIRYGRTRDAADDGVVEETVIERRPVIEEVVVRRRVVDENNN
jgi:sporulation protein YlmC with PRC-barrel domain